MKINKKQASFAAVLVLLLIGVFEIALGLLAFVFPKVDRLLTSTSDLNTIPATIADARLGHRPNPAYPGHDRKGFRNLEVPAKAHIIALGDSQTYGTNVEPEDTWPRQLESMSRKTVYSMACPGYGPAQSLILWNEAVALSPKMVIEAFYAGNDLFESFHLVYNRGQLPELKSSDPQLQASVRAAEESEPIAERVSRLLSMGPEATTVNLSLRGLLSQHSKIYGLLRRVRYESTRLVSSPNSTSQEKWEMAKTFAEAHPAYCQLFSDGQVKTIFTSEYRLSALDLGDPRIAEGLLISLRAIQRMHECAATRKIQFLVVLIPTKEAVFRKLWPTPSMSYHSLTENEERVWSLTKDFLEHKGIEYLDSLPMLQEQLATGIQPYPVSSDGHPNEQGHKAIATLVSNHVNSGE